MATPNTVKIRLLIKNAVVLVTNDSLLIFFEESHDKVSLDYTFLGKQSVVQCPVFSLYGIRFW